MCLDVLDVLDVLNVLDVLKDLDVLDGIAFLEIGNAAAASVCRHMRMHTLHDKSADAESVCGVPAVATNLSAIVQSKRASVWHIPLALFTRITQAMNQMDQIMRPSLERLRKQTRHPQTYRAGCAFAYACTRRLQRHFLFPGKLYHLEHLDLSELLEHLEIRLASLQN